MHNRFLVPSSHTTHKADLHRTSFWQIDNWYSFALLLVPRTWQIVLDLVDAVAYCKILLAMGGRLREEWNLASSL